jgi:divalent metal cation (Fe/Co/Zn/Cd) transporter
VSFSANVSQLQEKSLWQRDLCYEQPLSTVGLTDMLRRYDRILVTASCSIVIALVVMALKYLAYRIAGSVALYSDALESIVNVVTGAVALWAVWLSGKPADARHPFGHSKAEYFSAVLEGVLIVVAALIIPARSLWSVPQSAKR